jgi:16S rRNA A1518/A1519 N6-dimethyltransferase RsmA/KsgA/DIM1 with predicted DNA glycosylase/AP lyase activity
MITDFFYIKKARNQGLSNFEHSNLHHTHVANFINQLVPNNGTILEVGCGNGYIQNYINSFYYGIDNYCDSNNLNIILGDAYKLPFQRNLKKSWE